MFEVDAYICMKAFSEQNGVAMCQVDPFQPQSYYEMQQSVCHQTSPLITFCCIGVTTLL